MRGRAILADEVGLGKTVEAGLILKEYAIRGLVRRVLILTPASLTSQWREEMESKFALPFRILRKPSDWERTPLLIASMGEKIDCGIVLLEYEKLVETLHETRWGWGSVVVNSMLSRSEEK